jgi:hypothetical protein
MSSQRIAHASRASLTPLGASRELGKHYDLI